MHGPYQANLSPSQYQYRLPFYSTVYGTNVVAVVNDSQAVMDQEIQYAHNSGLNYWAFDWYYPTAFINADNYNHGLYNYLSSAYKSQMNFCLLLQGNWLGPASNWDTTVKTLINYMNDPNYQTVLGNRPLVYIFNVGALATTFGSDAAAKNAMNTLRKAAVAAGLGAPYIVAQVWNPTDGVNAINNNGLDAMGAYAITADQDNQVQQYPHSDLRDANLLFWNKLAATGYDMVPTVTTGFNNSPRWTPNGFPGLQPSAYYADATPSEIGDDLITALNWTYNNAPAAKANTILMYAWNESDEGGWLVPTIAEDGNRLSAVHQAITTFSPQRPVFIANNSFESPVANPWYVVPKNGINANFGWYTTAAPGTYLLARPEALHFSKAASGQQALMMSQSTGAIWQDIGTPLPNTTYTITFSLLTGKYNGDVQGTIQVQVFMGSTLLASKNFASPSTKDTWGSNSIQVNTDNNTKGDLTIKFIPISGNPWLDNVGIN